MTNSLLAEAGVNVYHEFARLQSMTQWHWLVLCAVCLMIASYAVSVIWFDSVPSHPGSQPAST